MPGLIDAHVHDTDWGLCALSATVRHGDFRTRSDGGDACGCAERGLKLAVDGQGECRRATRNELRKGAHAIKIVASSEVASPTDPIANLQFSAIRAIVEEASFEGRYVMAHAYSTEAIRRCPELAVRSIEHGNLIDSETAGLASAKRAYVVAMLVFYSAMHECCAEIGPGERIHWIVRGGQFVYRPS